MLITEIPWLVTMGLLLLASAFFSSSEAAWFYLGRKDRQLLAGGNRAQRVAVGLLEDSDRLLSAVLFWNLVINLAYFTISSILALRLERDGHPTRAGLFTVGSLFAIIVFSEMLPKNLAVLKPRLLVSWFAIPLATMVRLLDGVQWIFQMVGRVSLRVIWPTFTPEPDLRVDDLERAVDLSVDDDALLDQEDEVLRAIVLLSDIRADELMRPRIACRTFRPPVSLSDLKGKVPPSGYLLVTESESDEIASAIELDALSAIPVEHLEHHATPVVYVPWCIPVSAVLEQMRRRDRRVAVVVNELGENDWRFDVRSDLGSNLPLSARGPIGTKRASDDRRGRPGRLASDRQDDPSVFDPFFWKKATVVEKCDGGGRGARGARPVA